MRCWSLLISLLAATAYAPPALACTGDCDANGVVTINELINGVNIVLGRADLDVCRACDRDGNGAVTIAELIGAVRATLDGCPATPTPSPSQSLPTPMLTAPPTATATQPNCEVAGVICTVGGTGRAEFGPDGLPALQTSLYFPIDITFDRAGRPLIMDYNNLVLRRLNADGTLNIVMGIPLIEDFPTDGVLARDTPLHHASDAEFDATGRMYVAGDHVPVVFRVDTDDRVYTVAGTETFGYSGDGGPALQAELNVPFGVVPDAAGGVYISDLEEHVVRHVDGQGTITTVAGSRTPDGAARPGYDGDGGPATGALLNGPGHLQIGPDQALYFCETKNHVIRRLRPNGTIDTVAGNGERGYAGDDGPAIAAKLDRPSDLRFAPNGDLYIADANNNVIRRVDTNGVITTVVGIGTQGFSGDGGSAAAALLRRPSGVNFDVAGSMWVADYGNHRVRRVWHFLR